MRVFHKGNPLNLTDNDLLGSGGEGKVYAVGNLAYKIYHTTSSVLPLGKIQELGKIQDERVVGPIDPLYDTQGELCGYSMRRVNRYRTLCEVSTIAYRERHNVPSTVMESIVGELERLLPLVHNAGVVLGDLNDLNVLVDPFKGKIAIIDLDSAQTPSYPLTAIMESIRDPLTPPFTTDQDWYALAVLAFRAFTGSGPYRGFHPSGAKEPERKEKGLTCFDKGARLPASAYPLSSIPKRYQDWIISTLSHKYRGAPGGVGPQTLPTPTPAPAVGNTMWGEEIPGATGFKIFSCGGESIRVKQDSVWTVVYQNITRQIPRGSIFVLTPRDPHPFAVWQGEDHSLWGMSIHPSRPDPVALPVQATEFHHTCADGLLYQNEDGLFRLDWSWTSQTPFFHTSRVGNCHPHLTHLFRGGALTFLLGTPHLILLDSSGTTEHPLPHLKGQTVLSVHASPRAILLTYLRGGSPVTEMIRRPSMESFILDDTEGIAIAETPSVVAVQTTHQIHLFTKEGPLVERSFSPPAELTGPIWEFQDRICGMIRHHPHILKTKKP